MARCFFSFSLEGRGSRWEGGGGKGHRDEDQGNGLVPVLAAKMQ